MKVLDIIIPEGGFKLKACGDRYFQIAEPTEVKVITDIGVLNAKIRPGFVTNFRSGGLGVDRFIDPIGDDLHQSCWLVHDCNGYGQDLSFEDTNLLLFVMLRDLAGYRTSKAALIQLAVSLSRSWYGTPKPGDWCLCNVDKVRTVWMPETEVA